MALHPRFYSKDEEQGKRDDDFRPKRKHNMTEQLNPLRWRKRRLFAILSICVLLYFFVKNIPTDLGTAEERLNPAYKTRIPLIKDAPQAEQPVAPTTTRASGTEPIGAPPVDGEDQELGKRYYNGMIKYYRLASSLNLVAPTSKDAGLNRNVLFAASSMKSLANLLPLACEMSEKDTNWVHVAILSRVELSIKEIREINGIAGSCPSIVWHDARADYNEYSSDARHEAVVSGAMSHIKSHMSPHAVIVDDEAVEDPSFSRAIRRRSKDLFIPLIEIPSGGYDNFRFITNLDHGSLSNWYTPTIEIVVQAHKESVGSFIRLLRTLGAADYKGIRLPKLTLNLATSIQPALRTFLNNFKWPPRYEPATQTVDPVTVRHQVQSQQLSSEQSALRFVESFYPATPDHHILLLSPQVEVSAQYMMYIQYTILRYKYSASKKKGAGELLGLSLDTPAKQLDGTVFTMENESPFLYAVPSSSSLLVFGDKWSTFHSYLTHRISATHLGNAMKREKLVSETEPAWKEYLLELIQARGWATLYPSKGFVTVHNELAQIPEEFDKENKAPVTESSSLEEPFLTASFTPELQDHEEERLSNPQTPLHHLVTKLVPLEDLTVVSSSGESLAWDESQSLKADYLHEFRREIGGCDATEAKRPRIIQDDKADDLFCIPSVDIIFDTSVEAGA